MSPVTVLRMDHVAVDVTDVSRAKQFYGGLIGLKELPRPASFDFPGAWYELSNIVLHLVGRPQQAPESKRHFALWVADVHGTARILGGAGYPIAWDPRKIPGVDRFFIADPDGNRLEFQGPDDSTA